MWDKVIQERTELIKYTCLDKFRHEVVADIKKDTKYTSKNNKDPVDSSAMPNNNISGIMLTFS